MRTYKYVMAIGVGALIATISAIWNYQHLGYIDETLFWIKFFGWSILYAILLHGKEDVE